jgi:hypothetical protein
MNMILHGIDAPNRVHTTTLTENLSDVQEKDRFDVILANPLFGAKERAEVQQNLPIKTGETAFAFAALHQVPEGRRTCGHRHQEHVSVERRQRGARCSRSCRRATICIRPRIARTGYYSRSRPNSIASQSIGNLDRTSSASQVGASATNHTIHESNGSPVRCCCSASFI